jgi:hypothetical protein
MSRRQIAEWLSLQEVNQVYHPSKGKPKDIESSMTTPNTILAIDLVNMEKMKSKGSNTYLMVLIWVQDMYIVKH